MLLTITIADPEQFSPKSKLVTYIEIFVELYNWKNCGQVHEIKMVELGKMRTLITKNPCNLSACQIIEIFLVLRSAHMVSKDQNKVVFYINNYIDWDQFYQLYDPDWKEKDVQNIDVITRKLRPALIKTTNHRLEVVRNEQRKREKMVERRKIKVLAARHQGAREEINLSCEKEENYESNIGDKTDSNQVSNDENPLQLWEEGVRENYKQ